MEPPSLLLGVALGLSIAAPPGPVNSLIAAESLKSKLHGTSVGLGAMTADLVFFVLTLLFGRFIPTKVTYVLYVVGGLFMIWLAFGVLRSSSSTRTTRANYFTGLSMGLTNPFQISWWLTSGLFMIQQLGVLAAPGFFAGILIWITLFPYIVNRYARGVFKIIKLVSFLILLIFGIFMLSEGSILITRIL